MNRLLWYYGNFFKSLVFGSNSATATLGDIARKIVRMNAYQPSDTDMRQLTACDAPAHRLGAGSKDRCHLVDGQKVCRQLGGGRFHVRYPWMCWRRNRARPGEPAGEREEPTRPTARQSDWRRRTAALRLCPGWYAARATDCLVRLVGLPRPCVPDIGGS